MKPIPHRLNKWWLSPKSKKRDIQFKTPPISHDPQNKAKKSRCFSRGIESDTDIDHSTDITNVKANCNQEGSVYNYNAYPNINTFHTHWFFDANDANALLGKGGQGTVYKCYKKAFISNISDEYVSGMTYCCKVYDLSHVTDTLRRVKIIKNIIAEYHFVKTRELLHYESIYIDGKQSLQVIIVMQQFTHSLAEIDKCLSFDLTEKHNAYNKGIVTFQDNECLRRFAFDIACNIKRIHDFDSAHFDIKPENIMFDEKTHRWCLIDYGLYRRMGAQNEAIKRKGMFGTKGFIAPEISYNAKSGRSILTKACDIYSFGLVLLHVINGGKLYEHHKVWENKKRLFIQNGNPRFMHSMEGHQELCQYLKYLLVFGVMDANIYALLREVLEFDRKKRATIDDVLQMKYFEDIVKRTHDQLLS